MTGSSSDGRRVLLQLSGMFLEADFRAWRLYMLGQAVVAK